MPTPCVSFYTGYERGSVGRLIGVGQAFSPLVDGNNLNQAGVISVDTVRPGVYSLWYGCTGGQ
jgi:hypothetical protein